jgi:hypothetical protein
MLRILTIIIWLICVRGAYAEEISAGDYYVSANQLSVRSAPSTTARIEDTLIRKQKVEVFEVNAGWARISKYSHGAEKNKEDQFAHWVSADYLTATEPTGALAENTNIERYIKNSDNYSKYRENFIEVSKTLVEQGRCNLSDYKNIGGWVSSITHKSEPIYFTYCGGFSTCDKVYINAKSGEILN